MKKLLIGLALLAVVAAPVAALAATDTPIDSCTLKRNITVNIEGTDTPISKGTIVNEANYPTAWGMICLLNALNSIIDWVFTILVILTVGFTIAGAWTILTAGGKAENVTAGKNFILYAAIGLAVAFLARALPGIVKSVAGF